MPTLAVNIDHVATLRQQRRGAFPDLVQAALLARRVGADAIIAHLREDRRHVQDADVRAIAAQATPFHFEMAASWEMRALALEVRPRLVCLVPEKREELTTEGGLAVAGRVPFFVDYCAPLNAAGIGVSLFIEAAADQVEAAKAAGAQYVELHTGHYADATDAAAREAEFRRILDAIRLGRDLGLVVNLGHGLDLDNILPFRDVAGVNEYSIGFSIIARAVFVGLETAVREMLELIRTFPDEAGQAERPA